MLSLKNKKFLRKNWFFYYQNSKEKYDYLLFTVCVFTTPSFSCPFPRKSYYKDKPLIIIECSIMFAIDVMSNHSCCKWYEKWYKSGFVDVTAILFFFSKWNLS